MFWNAYAPMLVTEEGMLTLVNKLFWKALAPILVIVVVNPTVVIELFWKAPSPIVVIRFKLVVVLNMDAPMDAKAYMPNVRVEAPELNVNLGALEWLSVQRNA